MKKILMMILPNCPFCKQADQMIEELLAENPAYRDISIERVDEQKDTELAESLDYYYVPCLFVDGKKLLEGVPTKEKVQAVLDAALDK